ncbi:putative integral membrane protein [Eutypa lata UCREL1]|uniref:Putative integral membrane protein n=1 Tax=Eutypa lata (strain UCR-EL1) TaxID=1287681 RepID=M7SDZ8_EUTLA|nr:putative integral membrane protein [Eutypa lata UCREL1]
MFIHRELWWDDCTAVIAWAGTIVICVLQLVALQQNGGGDTDYMTPEEFKRFEKLFMSTQISSRLGILFAKLSILLLYLRAFFPARVSKSAFWWVIQVTIWVNVMYTVVHVLVIALQCVPSKQPWGTHRIHESGLLIAAAVVNIISDVAVVVIPIGAIWKIQISREKKWALWSLFGFGMLAPIASLARLVYQAMRFDDENQTAVYVITSFLATAEQVIAVVGGCIPVLAKFCAQRERQHPVRSHHGQNSSQALRCIDNVWDAVNGAQLEADFAS